MSGDGPRRSGSDRARTGRQGREASSETTLADDVTLDGVVRSFDVKFGLAFGGLTYVLGYALTYVLVALDSGADVQGVTAEFGTSSVTAVGWLFYGAHYVPLKMTAGLQSRSVNILSGSTLAIPKPVYFAVPIVLLGAFGFLLAKHRTPRDGTRIDAAISGSSLIAGYLPAMLVGSYVFVAVVERQSVAIVYGPDVGTVIATGVLLPVVAGGLGGYFAVAGARNG